MSTLDDLFAPFLAMEKGGAKMPPSLPMAEAKRLAASQQLSLREVEIEALRRQIVPERYRRNLGTVGWEGQIALLEATVAIVGAGGLGGWIIEGLARMGVGHLIIIDGDRFEENNLNRQLGCIEATLGQAKAQILANRVAALNQATEATAHVVWLTEENGPDLLRGAQIIVDALDALPIRLALQRIAAKLDVPMVHGAIGGHYGQVMTILPGDHGLLALYGDGPVPEHGVETELGNPAATPMMIAAWQIQEVVKLITGQGTPLQKRILMMDALAGDVTQVELG
jgi:molybdopterin-synthase adenylyltransferase